MRGTLVILSCITLMRVFSNNVLCQEVAQQDKAKNSLDFSAKLLQLLYKEAQQNGNVVFSPVSIYTALASLHFGTDGTTRDEIGDFLGFPKDATKIQQTYQDISQLLQTIANTTEVKNNLFGPRKPTIINIVNGLFVQNGINLTPSYVSQVQSNYNVQVSNLDFAKESGKATDAVNQFVSNSTNGKISQLFSSPVPSDISVLLATSYYTRATWDHSFADLATDDENFDTGSGNIIAKLMWQSYVTPYIDLPELQSEAISLPFAGDDISVFFLLPYSNQTLDNVIPLLNGDTFQRIVKGSKPESVKYKIPQLKVKWSNDIKNILAALGIKELFGNNAKLNNIASNSNNGLKVSQVAHAAEIELNGKGTQANSIPIIKSVWDFKVTGSGKEFTFNVNRPFAFLFYHYKTESIQLLGAIHNPTTN